jgi:prevent-host-death family protein
MVPDGEPETSLARLVDRVVDEHEHVVITRNGRPAAAIVPIDAYPALEETAEILSDPDALAAIADGRSELAHDETVTLEELRAELAERRAAR